MPLSDDSHRPDEHGQPDSSDDARRAPIRRIPGPRTGPDAHRSTCDGSPNGYHNDEYARGRAGDRRRADTFVPDAYEIAASLSRLPAAVLNGQIDNATANTIARLLKQTDDVRHRQVTADTAATAARNAPRGEPRPKHADTSSGTGDQAGPPRPGEPRLVASSALDALIEHAATFGPHLLSVFETAFDDHQRRRAVEVTERWLQRGVPPQSSEGGAVGASATS